jgi:hypothetical protein
MKKKILKGFAAGLFMFCMMGASEAATVDGTQVEINNLDYITGFAIAVVGAGPEFTNPPDTILGGLTSVDVFDVTSTTSALVYNVGSSIIPFAPAPNRLSISFLASSVPTIASVTLDASGASAGYNDINRVGFTSNSVYYDFGDLPRDLSSVRLDVQFVPVPATVFLFGSGLLGLVGIARKKNLV